MLMTLRTAFSCRPVPSYFQLNGWVNKVFQILTKSFIDPIKASVDSYDSFEHIAHLVCQNFQDRARVGHRLTQASTNKIRPDSV